MGLFSPAVLVVVAAPKAGLPKSPPAVLAAAGAPKAGAAAAAGAPKAVEVAAAGAPPNRGFCCWAPNMVLYSKEKRINISLLFSWPKRQERKRMIEGNDIARNVAKERPFPSDSFCKRNTCVVLVVCTHRVQENVRNLRKSGYIKIRVNSTKAQQYQFFYSSRTAL